jgi:signal peptidase I
MISAGSTLRGATLRTRTAEFEPVAFDAKPPLETPPQHWVFDYRLRVAGETEVHVLEGDPAAIPDPSAVRLLLNAASTFAVVLVAGLMMAATAPLLVGLHPVVVVSPSMEPAIHVADVVVTSPSDGRDLGEGAVINHRVDDGMRLHRVIEVTADGYRTKGDANAVADSGIVTPSQVSGIGILVVPFVGLPRIWVDQGKWLQLVALTTCGIGALYMGRRAFAEPDVAPWQR